MGLLKKIIKAIAKPAINGFKGEIGEAKVNSTLNPWFFDKVEHRQINNLILIDKYGKSHQIDHVEIRQNGIFCIETKNYIGWIFGGRNQDAWTQCLYTGKKYHFVNPLKQNQSHIYHIHQVLGNKYKINSVIVMVRNNADKIHISNVVNLCDLKSYLNNYNDGTFYSIEDMDAIYNKLLAASSAISNEEHVANIRKTQNEIRENICPRCGGKLVERSGRYGLFYGCSNYPDCKFTLSLH